MKLLSIDAEIRALKTICGDSEKLSAVMLGTLEVDDFYYEPSASAYRVLRKYMKDNGEVPDWTNIVNDPAISESSRKILRATKQPPIVGLAKATSVIKTLGHYRKLRGLVNMANTVLDQVEEKDIDLDGLLDDVTNQLTKVRVGGTIKNNIYHIGKMNNTTALVKESLYGKAKPSVPTGFRAFDEKNGGILLGSLFTIGANTGGGKTAMAVNLLKNMSLAAEDVCIVPLEMTAMQTMDRLHGINTGIEVNKISQKKLSEGEKKKVKASYRKYVQDLKDLNTQYSIYEPPEDLDIEQMLMSLKPYGHKVILIDYISLLKGVDGEDQWRQLGNVARYAKMYAKNNNCIVILLCQVSDEGKIRYAQAIAEHSNNCWIWTMPGEDAETSIMDIKQLKARNQLRFGFQLLSHNPSMLIKDVDYDSAGPIEPDEEESDDAYLKDVNEEEEE